MKSKDPIETADILNTLHEIEDYLSALYMMSSSVPQPSQRSAWTAVIGQAESVLDSLKVRLGEK